MLQIIRKKMVIAIVIVKMKIIAFVKQTELIVE